MKSSTCASNVFVFICFHMKTKILADFQICISASSTKTSNYIFLFWFCSVRLIYGTSTIAWQNSALRSYVNLIHKHSILLRPLRGFTKLGNFKLKRWWICLWNCSLLKKCWHLFKEYLHTYIITWKEMHLLAFPVISCKVALEKVKAVLLVHCQEHPKLPLAGPWFLLKF